MSSPRLPDFLIIGAPKSGTTSLYYYLQQHPEIFLPSNKEPFFFSLEGVDISSFKSYGEMKGVSRSITNIDDYIALFKSAPPNSKLGEASTLYLADPIAAKRIQNLIPKVKLIAILRNPIDRAYSHYQHFRKDGLDPHDTFYAALKSEQQKIDENWFPSYYFIQAGFYFKQLSDYLSLFPKEQLAVFLYEDLQNSTAMVRKIFRFLGVDDSIPLETDSVFNRSGVIKNQWLYKLNRNSQQLKLKLRSMIPVKIWGRMKKSWDKLTIDHYPPMAEIERRFLIDLYSEDIIKLQGLLDRDLSHWIKS